MIMLPDGAQDRLLANAQQIVDACSSIGVQQWDIVGFQSYGHELDIEAGKITMAGGGGEGGFGIRVVEDGRFGFAHLVDVSGAERAVQQALSIARKSPSIAHFVLPSEQAATKVGGMCDTNILNLGPEDLLEQADALLNAVKSAESVGIRPYFYDNDKKDLVLTESTILIEQTNQKNLGEEIKDLVKAEQKVSDYEIYLRLVNRDGIPQLIINDALPIIENEVNTVLDHMMAGFQLGITSEDKSINLYIKYDDQEWPLSLSSGMEKFVSSLALRVGLINVSNLPSPNFLVIDEGFGTLDTDNLSNMKGAFDYLKTRFDSVFIISHLDTIKDFMDYLLPLFHVFYLFLFFHFTYDRKRSFFINFSCNFSF